jgi:thioredoxin reductase (NADPH)
VLLTVDDDPAVARAIERDLRRRYGERYRVVRAESGDAALDVLRRLKLRDERVALILADQRMPRMNGVEFLTEAIEIYPDTRRALLTAYADTEAAIKAINDVDLDFYLRKPWEPPDDNLYPVVDDLLERWFQATPKDGVDVRIIAPSVDARSHALRDVLARNAVPYGWLDADGDPEAARLLTAARLERPRMPVAVLGDGSVLEDPEPLELAERLGLPTRAEHEVYDLVVVGAGPAGLAAGVYGGSEGLRTLLVERQAPGGQAGQSSRIENYLGFPTGLSGQELAQRAYMQARRFHTEVLTVQAATSLEAAGSSHSVRLSDGAELRAHAIILATGVAYRRLEAPGVDELTGAGVYYGAPGTADDALAGEHVLVVGAANSAGQAVMDLATKRDVAKVTLLCRGDSLEKAMSQYLVDRIYAQDNVEVLLRTAVAEARGDGRLEQAVLRSPDGDTTVDTGAMFIFIGAKPETDWLDGRVERDERGFVLSGPDLLAGGRRPQGWPLERDPFLLETNVPGVFVAGDVRHGSLKRVASSVGEGAMAVRFVHEHLAGR